jgi:ribonuclease Z
MLRLVRIVVVLLVITGAALVALRIPSVQDRLVRFGAARLLAQPTELFEGDGMRVLACGTSSPFPHRERARPCLMVIAGGKFYVVDTGSGSWNNLALWSIPGERIGAVFITHFHSDHIGDLGEFNLQTWVAGRPGPLPVYGPAGVESVVAGFNEAYKLDTGYRVAHHGADFLRPANEPMEARPFAVGSDGRVVIVDEGGLRVTAFAVNHKPIEPAVGYRFDFSGRSVVISGDTAKYAGVVAAAKGADVLFHEAQANHLVKIIGEQAAAHGRPRVAKVMGDIPSYHTSPVEAAEVANEASVRLLVLYHLTPPPPSKLFMPAFMRGVSDVRSSGVVVADDGTIIELPANSTEVKTSSID